MHTEDTVLACMTQAELFLIIIFTLVIWEGIKWFIKNG